LWIFVLLLCSVRLSVHYRNAIRFDVDALKIRLASKGLFVSLWNLTRPRENIRRASTSQNSKPKRFHFTLGLAECFSAQTILYKFSQGKSKIHPKFAFWCVYVYTYTHEFKKSVQFNHPMGPSKAHTFQLPSSAFLVQRTRSINASLHPFSKKWIFQFNSPSARTFFVDK